MAAFDKILSGFSEMDRILDNIRLGDNVVWQITELDEFRLFAGAFVRQALGDGREVIYIRFAQHEPILDEQKGVHVRNFNPDEGFEAFTVAIHDEITRQGKDAFYVFDCLSELQSVWYTDLMMGNFFCVTCPYLFELDTVAYFPLIRGRHSFDAVARIRETTQLFLDVYSNRDCVYLHPLKVWNRYSDKMFLPHALRLSNQTFTTVQDGIEMSRFYQTLHEKYNHSQDQNYDSHDRFFNEAELEFSQGRFSAETQDLIIRSTMTRDARLSALVKKYFSPQDYFSLRARMIGSGAIGGKACGMLLARKIVDRDVEEFGLHNEPHDSFYIGSDVYYTYIVSNGNWKLHIRQRMPEFYFEAAEELRARLLQGTFPPKIKEQFELVLQYFGQSPYIVRSSSFLEDGFGNAFAGKYESVFCVNQGSVEQRIAEFEQAVRRVYASTMNEAALEYRRARGLALKDEQMAVLVQRVSGSYYSKYFMPGMAGVGYSHSAYQWHRDMDPSAGMLRVVVGLGTKAVDRTREDYPRLANLDRPSASLYTSPAQKHQYSQRYVDALDCERNCLTELNLDALLPSMPQWYKNLVLEHDTQAEASLRSRGKYRPVWFASCQGMLENRVFTSLMQKLLKSLEAAYGCPVDIEYAVNMNAEGDFVVNLLQCRPLYLGSSGARLDTDYVSEKVFFEIKDSSLGSSGFKRIDCVVQIDPLAYYEYPYQRKNEVAAAIETINRHFEGSGKALLLMTPGRVGTSSPELGVPVNFRGISNFSVICEVSDDRAGYRPELSYGSHMFQDLVEAEICYGAIFGNEKTLQYEPDLFADIPDLFGGICPDFPQLSPMVQVKEPKSFYYRLDAVENHAVCAYMTHI